MQQSSSAVGLQAAAHPVPSSQWAAPPSPFHPVGEARGSTRLRQQVRAELKARASRARFLPDDLFSDPAWDILLQLFAAEQDGRRLAVSAVGLSANIPLTTALRWLKALEQKGLVARRDDPLDARRSFLELSERGMIAMTRYFEETPRAHPAL